MVGTPKGAEAPDEATLHNTPLPPDEATLQNEGIGRRPGTIERGAKRESRHGSPSAFPGSKGVA